MKTRHFLKTLAIAAPIALLRLTTRSNTPKFLKEDYDYCEVDWGREKNYESLNTFAFKFYKNGALSNTVILKRDENGGRPLPFRDDYGFIRKYGHWGSNATGNCRLEIEYI